jgi:hypothetical protein
VTAVLRIEIGGGSLRTRLSRREWDVETKPSVWALPTNETTWNFGTGFEPLIGVVVDRARRSPFQDIKTRTTCKRVALKHGGHTSRNTYGIDRLAFSMPSRPSSLGLCVSSLIATSGQRKAVASAWPPMPTGFPNGSHDGSHSRYGVVCWNIMTVLLRILRFVNTCSKGMVWGCDEETIGIGCLPRCEGAIERLGSSLCR